MPGWVSGGHFPRTRAPSMQTTISGGRLGSRTTELRLAARWRVPAELAYMCVYIYMYTYIHTYIQTYRHIDRYMYIHRSQIHFGMRRHGQLRWCGRYEGAKLDSIKALMQDPGREVLLPFEVCVEFADPSCGSTMARALTPDPVSETYFTCCLGGHSPEDLCYSTTFVCDNLAGCPQAPGGPAWCQAS